MQGPAIAAWVRRATQGERLQATLDLADAAVAQAWDHVRRENPRAGPREVRAWIRARRGRDS